MNPRPVLAGSRGWFVVASLALALTGLVVQQVSPTYARAAAVRPAAPAVTGSPDVPSLRVTEKPAAPRVRAAAAVPPAPRPIQPAKVSVPPRPPAAAAADLCSGPGWQVRRGRAALATLRDNGSRSGVTVSFLPGRSGFLGLTYPAAHHVDVFVRSCGEESTALLRHVISHEMGHAYDAAHMTAASRAAYLAMRGIPAGTPWFGCSYCTDFATPAGDFAETYSQWQRGASDSRTQIAAVPGPAQLAAIAAAFFG